MRKAFVAALLALAVAAACSPEQDGPSQAAGPPEVRGKYDFPSPQPTSRAEMGWLAASCELPVEHLRRIRRGYAAGRSPEMIPVPRAPNFFGGFTTYGHSGPWPYMQRVPLVFYGPGFIRSQGSIRPARAVTVADLAPTLAELLHTTLPEGRPGRPVTEALLPRGRRAGVPRAIVTVVWDGGGTDVLQTWPGAWPVLRDLMASGTSVAGATVGSSPSVTPAIHATIGTGTFPKQHGIVDIPLRIGDRVVADSYGGRSPKYLKTTTLADIFDRSTGGASKVGMLAYKGWHLGMMGHGAGIPGGDKDTAIIVERSNGALVSNPEYYSLPPYLKEVPGFDADIRRVDGDDGKLDSRWLGHDMLEDPAELRHTPVWALYQTRLIKELIRREGYGDDRVPDLFFTNYKQIDEVGHDWNMLNPEERNILEYSDAALGDLVSFLNAEIGRRRWVLAMTADHGQVPAPTATGAWPIHIETFEAWVARHYDVEASELFENQRPLAFWLNMDTVRANNIDLEEMADYILKYTIGDDQEPGQEYPPQYKDRLEEPVFAAAFPSSKLGEIWRCATQ